MNRIWEFLTQLWDPWATPFGVGATALAGHVWKKFRGRMVNLRWVVEYQNVATPVSDAALGSINITHNNQPVHNLQFAIVRLENDSQKDLTDLVIRFSCDASATILGASGTVRGSFQRLPWSADFLQEMDAFPKLLKESAAQHVSIEFFMRRRDFHVPVLNRGNIADFVFLLTYEPGRTYHIQASCDHVGVRLRRTPLRIQIFGVPQNPAIGWGLLLGGGLALVIPQALQHTTGIAAAAFVTGVCVTFIGVGVIHLGRLIRKLMS